MKAIEIIKSKKRVFAIVGVTIFAILLIFAGGMVAFYFGNAEAGGIEGKGVVDLVVGKAAGIEIPAIEAGEVQEDAVQDAQADEAAAALEATESGQSVPSAQSQRADIGSSGVGASVRGTVGSANNGSSANAGSSSGSNAASQKKWVEDTQKVWVEDKAAWTESVPVYGTKEVSICNVCGADITGNTAAHSKAHMMAGEGSGHHSEVQRIVTGYNSVSHPAEGHWETRVVGGHWE